MTLVCVPVSNNPPPKNKFVYLCPAAGVVSGEVSVEEEGALGVATTLVQVTCAQHKTHKKCRKRSNQFTDRKIGDTDTYTLTSIIRRTGQ